MADTTTAAPEEVAAVPAPATEEKKEEDKDTKILSQVEFYFSDSNLPKDKFLKNVLANNDGWVPLATLLTFKRLQSLTTDMNELCAALRKSEGFLQVDEEGTKVRRVPDVPETIDNHARVVYAKRFPFETTIDDVSKFFSQFGKVLSVRFRRNFDSKKFKGTGFIEFSTEEEAKKACEQDGKLNFVPDAKRPLQIIMSEQWRKEKAEYAESKKNNKNKKDEKEPSGPEYAQDCVVYFENVGEGVTRESLKDVFNEYGTAVYVDFSIGNKSGYIRYDEKGGAKTAAAALTEKQVELGGEKTVYRALEGEEEKTYFEKVESLRKDKANKGGRGRGRGKGRGGGRGGRGKRSRDGDDGASANKKQATSNDDE